MLTDQTSMQDYLQKLQQLSEDVRTGLHSPEMLLSFIDQSQQQAGDDANWQDFFTAERAFHSTDYESALKHYLKAKQVPLFQFFCYRASAYIAHRKEHLEQALKFARKAYALCPEDQATAAILQTLLQATGEQNPAEALTTPFHVTETTSFHMAEEELPVEHSSAPLLQDTTVPVSTDDAVAMPSFTQTFYPTEEPVSQPLPSSPYRETEMNYQLDMLNTAEQALETRIQNFQRQRAHYLSQYVKQARQRPKLGDYCLYVFNGWENQPVRAMPFDEKDEQAWGYFLLNSHMRKPSCGFYLRWNGVGMAINPGKRFLESFHRSGLHITDIDIVIVTQTDPDAYADVQQIYDLNYQLNKISPELQILRYYLNHKAYLELAPVLKPNFKQERNAIHCLELFVDSPEVEKVELTPDVTLNYFPTSTQEALSHHQQLGQVQNTRNGSSPLGIRLDMRQNNGENKKTVKMGYLSGTPWSPLLGHHLGHCDLLFAGFGNTHVNDFGKLNYNEHCLGYFGSYSLLEEVKPRLMFCCEFDGREGDIRLEVGKKMRQESSHAANESTNASSVILPADNGLFLDLQHLQIRCSVSQALVDPAEVRVVKSGEAFSSLLYLAPSCLLE
jgi:hypothetical protein